MKAVAVTSWMGRRVRLVACAAWLCWAAHARAQDRVELAYASSDAEAPDLERTLASALELPGLRRDVRRVARVDARALLEPPPDAAAALARIWVDVTQASRAIIYVVDRSWTRSYVRTLLREPDNPALDHAQIGEIVRSAVQALQEGAVIGIARAEPAAASPAPRPPVAARAAETAGAAYGGGLFYGAALRADHGALAHGPGVYGYALAPIGAFRLGAALALQYQPHHIARAGAGARLDTLALRGGPVLEAALGAALKLQLLLAYGTDLVRIDPDSDARGLRADAARWAAFPLIEAAIGVRAPIAPALELLVTLLADVDLVDTRYVFRTASATTVVEDPWSVRPGLRVGLGFD
jgi:hypothetical protein